MNEQVREACERQIGYKFCNCFWLRKALTHSSSKSTNHLSNERLEFLGDAVLGMVISEHLFTKLKSYTEGELTKIKSSVVSRATLSARSKAIGLDSFISVGKGMLEGEEMPVSVMANALEAVIGAIFLDGGIEPAREFVLRLLSNEIEESIEGQDLSNYKSLLQQYAQREFCVTPTYKVIGDTGPDHEKSFLVVTLIGGLRYESAWGRSKKEAEQRAAELTYFSLVHNANGMATPTEQP